MHIFVPLRSRESVQVASSDRPPFSAACSVCLSSSTGSSWRPGRVALGPGKWTREDLGYERDLATKSYVVEPERAAIVREVTVRCTPEQLWPWLVQLGYGRAGSYSYDCIDNDGKLSSDRIVPHLQNFGVDDTIRCCLVFGPPRCRDGAVSISASRGRKDGTWCLAVYSHEGGSRLT
jgi:hypothetical protein